MGHIRLFFTGKVTLQIGSLYAHPYLSGPTDKIDDLGRAGIARCRRRRSERRHGIVLSYLLVLLYFAIAAGASRTAICCSKIRSRCRF